MTTAALIACCQGLIVRIFENTARRGASVVLKMTKLFGVSFAALGRSPLTLEQKATLVQIPESIQTLENRFNLHVEFVPYAICPRCNCTYHPTYTASSKTPAYPSTCSEQVTPSEEPCGEALLSMYGKPFKVFLYYPFWDWFGWFIAIPGIEQYGDRFCEEVDAHTQIPVDKCNASDGSFIHQLRGPDGQRFIVDRGEEGRWLFTLNVDFFNVEGNRIRGRSASTGLIALTCLNLPLSIRNNHTFMYVPGLIPSSRHEPDSKNAEMRYFLRIPLKDMQDGYHCGARLHTSYKSNVPYSRIHRAAVAAAPCDLKASRPLGGFRDITSHLWCFFCQCWHKAHLGRTDCENWVKVDEEFLRAGAARWEEAPTPKDHAIPEEYHGTRTSALWILSYYKTRQLVPEPSHAVYGNTEQRYFRHILDLDNPDDPKRKPSKPSFRIAFYYPFQPPPHLSCTTIPSGRHQSALSVMFMFEEEAIDENRLMIFEWLHLLPDYMEARGIRLENLRARVSTDRRSFQGVMDLLSILSEESPRGRRAEDCYLKRLTGKKWDCLRFVCENLAIYPDPASPESEWRQVTLKKSEVTIQVMAETLLSWVSFQYISIGKFPVIKH